MTKKVLVWLDGPYGYLHYGITRHLSTLDDFEYYGMVSYKKDMEFYKNQNKSHFKELHYYPECYLENSSKPDLEYLSKIENELKLNFWLIASSERTFLQERNFFHIFTSDEILSIIESLTKFFYSFLKRIKPEFIIMQKTGENLANFLLFNIAKSLNIKTLMLIETRLSNSFVISDNLLVDILKDDFKQIKKDSSHEVKEYGPEFIQKRTLYKDLKSYLEIEFGKASFFEKLTRYSKRLNTNPEPIFYNKGKTKLKMISWRWNQLSKLRKRQNFLEKYALKEIPEKNFIYFPLPVQPESQSYAWDPFHVNTISIIENIAKSIPSNYLLFVKEHPGQKAKNWRSIEIYKKIISLPNVRLIHQNVNNYEMISKSDLVMLINNSSGLEALFYKKPVIVFGDVFYDVTSMVKKINKIEDLPSVIHDSLFSFKFSYQELSFLMESIERNHILVNYWGIMKELIQLDSILIHSGVEKTILEFEKVFENHDDDFSIMASAYHKII
jgi:hypothetical protein